MTKKKFYITTPIYYANSAPHVGSAYTTIAADVLARWHKQLGEEVFFLTGLDEHGLKIQETAEKKGVNPKKYVDQIASKFKKAFKLLNVTNNNFIRTTDPDHEKEVKIVLQKLYDKGFIYKGKYESLYCVGCEQYLTKRDLVDGRCPLHKREPELNREEAYIFKLSSFQNKLIKLIKSGKFNILPLKRRKEALSFIEHGLRDISVSRQKEKVYWGIELPFDKEHTCFVWVDAFWNYLSGLKTKEDFTKFWPPDVQLMAQDILRVHSTIWPALLLALGLKLPKQLFIHGYFTVDGQKMSKTLGNIIDPMEMVNKYGTDAFRYILFRDIPFGDDGDFSEKALVERYNGELANELGNLVSRALTLIGSNKLANGKFELKPELEKTVKAVSADFENLEINRAVEHVWDFIRAANKYIQDKKPWTKPKDIDDVIFTLAQSLRAISVLVWPFLPDSAEKIAKQLGTKVRKLADLSKSARFNIKKGDILFPKLEFKEGSKLDLRIGKILSVEDIEGADKLYKLQVDFKGTKKQVVAGLKSHFKKEDLIEKRTVFLANIEPAKLRGVLSEAMVLIVKNKDKESLVETKSGEGDIVLKSDKKISFDEWSKLKLKSEGGKVIYDGKSLDKVFTKMDGVIA